LTPVVIILKTIHKILIIALLQLLWINPRAFAQDSISVPAPVKHKLHGGDPMKATMMAVVFPGLGQIYNRKYWKIPLVYAGFGSLVYAISFNSSHYITYIQAYQDFTDDIPETNRFQEIPGIKELDPASYDKLKKPESYAYYKDQMLRMVDYYKRYRDLSYIGIAGWYLISILDANVDASLFNYDISDNLDVAILPMSVPMPGGMFGAGVNVSFTVNF
jgi:hypothetical protein